MGPDPEKIHNGANFGHSHSEFIVMNGDDDDEGMEVDEQQENDGYFRLNLDNANEYIPADDASSDEEEEEENAESKADESEFVIPENVQQQWPTEAPAGVPPIASISSELVASLWNEKQPSASGAESIELTNEKSQQIIKIASKINLPNAPVWLDQISAEGVLDRIKQQQQRADASRDSDKKL